MGLKPGQTNNRAGKPKGTKNKVNTNLRERITGFLSDEFTEVIAESKKLPAKDRLKFYTDLMQYGLPKLSSVDMQVDFDRMTDNQLDEIINRLTKKDNEQER